MMYFGESPPGSEWVETRLDHTSEHNARAYFTEITKALR